MRKAIQVLLAQGDEFQELKFDVTVERFTHYYNAADETTVNAETVFVIGFQGNLRHVQNGVKDTSPPGADALSVGSTLLTGTATLVSRMDGLTFFGIETLNVDTGSGTEILSVQGASAGSRGFELGGGFASTNVRLHGGNDRVYVSSNADLDAVSAGVLDFLTGSLHDVRGALNLDLGIGRHRLFVSDEAATLGDGSVATPARITDVAPASLNGLATTAEIWITGLGEPGGISYTVDPAGNLYDGVVYWTGAGADTLVIDGTHVRSHATNRTTTLLNTGLGNDVLTVDVDNAGQDDYLAIFSSGGATTDDPFVLVSPADDRAPDDDTIDASASSLPLVLIGGYGADAITGGTNNDLVFGDFGRVQYVAALGGPMVATHGFGGRGDVISDAVVDPLWAISRHLTVGGADTVRGTGGEDVLVGGSLGDRIDGGAHDDLVFGDAVELRRRNIDPFAVGSITNPRFRPLSGTQIYATTTTVAPATDALIGAVGTAQNYRDANGVYAPTWAEYVIENLFHTLALQTLPDNSWGADVIAGGPHEDEIFGQLGNDVIQGDGSIDYAATGCTTVGAARDLATNAVMALCPSADNLNGPDGTDYVEGGGGHDVIFGNQGQDDLIGGSSDMFTLLTPAQRPDGTDLIFGGSGTGVARNAPGDTTGTGHASDSDAIAGDNADIFRLVAVNGGTAPTGFLSFNYDNYSLAGLKIVPRAIVLLDYTAGGLDFNLAAAANDIGAADEIHGEYGDDFVYGMRGNDVLYGDAQDDTIVGGYGADWISGGTGDDGILGDDGRLFSSRIGTAEPLYGIAADPANTQNLSISTPGNIQQAIINVTGCAPLHGRPDAEQPRPGESGAEHDDAAARSSRTT